MFPAFELRREIVYEPTGEFIAIGKVKAGHALAMSEMTSSSAAMFLVHFCSRIDGKVIPKQAIMEMDMNKFNFIVNNITKD
jgi:hypothetical protein